VLWIRDILVRIRIRGSACLLLMDPDPAFFVIDLQDANKKVVMLFGTYIYNSKIKKVTKQNIGFFY
jgi:hypothetical protein